MPTKNETFAKVTVMPSPHAEEPLTPAEVLAKFKIKFKSEKQARKKIYELTRRRGNRPSMPSHRIGKELRFFWSEIVAWLHEKRRAA